MNKFIVHQISPDHPAYPYFISLKYMIACCVDNKHLTDNDAEAFDEFVRYADGYIKHTN